MQTTDILPVPEGVSYIEISDVRIDGNDIDFDELNRAFDKFTLESMEKNSCISESCGKNNKDNEIDKTDK